MTHVVVCLLLLAILAPPARAAGPEGSADLPRRHEQMRRLLEGLPKQVELARSVEIWGEPGNARDAEELRHARRHVRLAQRRIPRILTLLQSRTFGSRIFDYPGLLAVGKLEYIVERERPGSELLRYYTLHFGASVHPEKSSQKPWEFITRFDETGTILVTDDLVCRQ